MVRAGQPGPGYGCLLVRSPWLRNVAYLVLVVAVYYAFPVRLVPSDHAEVLSIAALLVSVTVLAWLILGQVRRQLGLTTQADRAAGDTEATGEEGESAVRLQSLLVLLYLAVVVFALGYYFLARATDDQFVGMETKTDALYFTMTTLSTVGFGDVHAAGQVARALVTAQIAFNLVFVGSLVSLLTSQIRRRATYRQPGRQR